MAAQDDIQKAQLEEQKKAEEEKQQVDAAFVGTGNVYNPMMARKFEFLIRERNLLLGYCKHFFDASRNFFVISHRYSFAVTCSSWNVWLR